MYYNIYIYIYIYIDWNNWKACPPGSGSRRHRHGGRPARASEPPVRTLIMITIISVITIIVSFDYYYYYYYYYFCYCTPAPPAAA